MRSRVLLPAILVLATTLVPAPIAAQDPPPGPIDPTAPALLVGTTRSGIARLIRIPLDGRNTPQVLVQRSVVPNDESPGWSLSPDGATALFAAGVSATVELIDLATGSARTIPTIGRIDPYELRSVWSADGGRVAIGDRGWSVIDIDTGTAAHLDADDARDLQAYGFDPQGRLIIGWQTQARGGETSWIFLRWDATTPDTPPTVIPTAEATVALAAPMTVSVPLGVSLGEVQPEDGRDGVGLRPLADGPARRLDGVADGYGQAVFDPTGRLAVVIVDEQVFLAAPDRPAVGIETAETDEDWHLDEHDVRFSAGSALVAFQNGSGNARATVHEVATGRTISVPLPTDVASARLVGVTGTLPLPSLAVAPAAEPARPAEITTGQVVGGSPLVVSQRIDRPAGAPAVLSVAFGRPASGDVIKTLDTHDFPIPLGSDAQPMDTLIVPGPGPGPDTITVVTGWADDRTAWTWRRGQEPRPLDLPKPFHRAIGLAWSADGRTLAGQPRYTATVVALWRPADDSSWFLPMPARWQGGWVERFAPDGRALIVSPPQCIDECSGIPEGELALPIDGSQRRPIPTTDWYPWDSAGTRVSLRERGSTKRVGITLPVGLRAIEGDSTPVRTGGRFAWVLATDGTQQEVLRYERPWVTVGKPARMPVPSEIAALEPDRSGWVRLSGEGTFDCRARTALASPRSGIHWLGGCREVAFTLP